MSDVPARRHALGLPAGSVRALLALLVVAMVCLMMVIPSQKEVAIPPYLVLLLFLMVGHFFAAAHSASAGSFPLYLPINLVRLLIIGALVVTVVMRQINDPDGLEKQLVASLDAAKGHLYLPGLVLGGFFLGIVFRMIVGRDNPSYVVQDVEAWLALIAVVGLLITALIFLVINPSLEGREPLTLPAWGGFLAVIIAFYYGARS